MGWHSTHPPHASTSLIHTPLPYPESNTLLQQPQIASLLQPTCTTMAYQLSVCTNMPSLNPHTPPPTPLPLLPTLLLPSTIDASSSIVAYVPVCFNSCPGGAGMWPTALANAVAQQVGGWSGVGNGDRKWEWWEVGEGGGDGGMHGVRPCC